MRRWRPKPARRRGSRGPGASWARRIESGGPHHATPFLTLGGAPAALVAAAALAASPSLAQGVPCDARDSVLALLANRYSEAPVALGVTGHGSLVEVLTDAGGTTWTILVTAPNGTSCIVLTGEGWRNLERAVQDHEA